MSPRSARFWLRLALANAATLALLWGFARVLGYRPPPPGGTLSLIELVALLALGFLVLAVNLRLALGRRAAVASRAALIAAATPVLVLLGLLGFAAMLLLRWRGP